MGGIGETRARPGRYYWRNRLCFCNQNRRNIGACANALLIIKITQATSGS